MLASWCASYPKLMAAIDNTLEKQGKLTTYAKVALLVEEIKKIEKLPKLDVDSSVKAIEGQHSVEEQLR